MALYGKQLANQVPDSTSGYQARVMFSVMANSLLSAYGTLQAYDPTGIAQMTGLDAGSVSEATAYLTDTSNTITAYYAHMPESLDPLSPQLLQELRTAVSISSAAAKTVDDLFGTSWLEELSQAIVEAAGTVTAKIASGISSVAGSFLGGTWWIWLTVALGLYAWKRLRP